MANQHQTLESLFDDIADAIRDKTGDSNLIVADTFPTAILNIPLGILEYEYYTTGVGSDASRIASSFRKSHTTPPVFLVWFRNDNSSDTTTNTNWVMYYVDWYRILGTGIPYSSSSKRYCMVGYTYRGTSTTSLTTGTTLFEYNSDDTTSSSSSYPYYWVSNTQVHPYTGSSSRYWRAGSGIYTCFAVWLPPSS